MRVANGSAANARPSAAVTASLERQNVACLRARSTVRPGRGVSGVIWFAVQTSESVSMPVRVEPSARRALMRSRWIQRSSVWTLMPSSAAAGSGKRQSLTRSRRGPVTLSIATSPRPHPTGCLTNLTPIRA